MNNETFTTDAGITFRCSQGIAATLSALSTMRPGGIGTLRGYRPTTGYVTAPIVDAQVITRFSTSRLYARKVAALNGVTFADVADGIASDEKLSKLSLADALAAFETRKAYMLDSLQKTLDGNRDDAHRAAHDRCYTAVGDGVKVHYVTEKDADGIAQPVLLDGLPVADSIMVAVLELNRTVRVAGVRKPAPNSGIPVRIGNCIDKVLNRRSVGYSTRSLREGNFDSFTASGQTLTAADVAGVDAGDVILEVAAAA